MTPADGKVLQLQLAEPGEDPLCDQILDILKSNLASNGEKQTSTETAAERIALLLPQGKPYSEAVGSFCETCYEVAEQIPYGSQEIYKLVSIIEQVMNSARFPKSTKVKNIQTHPDYTFQKLGETMRDWYHGLTGNIAEEPRNYVNFQFLEAAVSSFGILKDGVVDAVWILKQAFGAAENPAYLSSNQNKTVADKTTQEANVVAAAVWIQEYGRQLYRHIRQSQAASGARRVTLDEWRHWKKGFGLWAIGDNDQCKFAVFEEGREVSARAVKAMNKIEESA